MGEDFAVLLCLFAGEFVVLAADGEVVLVFGLGGLQIGLYARDGGVKILLREFAFPYGDDGSGEGVEALGVEFVAGDVAGHFLAQNCSLVLGTVYLVQPRWPCQKQPLMKMSARYLGRTRSG